MRDTQGSRLRTAALVVLPLVGTQSAAAGEVDVGGDITAASDYMFRGASQTMSAPALQGTLAIEHDSGWYGFVWASNIDFTEASDPTDGANVEVNLEIGYCHDLNDRVALTAGWTRYIFPGTRPGYDYDYGEWLGSFTVRDRHSLSVGYSDDVFGSGSTGIFYAVNTGYDLREQFSFDVELGHYDLDRAYDHSYNYVELSVAGRVSFLDWQLSYFKTSHEAEELFYPSTVNDRLVLALGVSF